MNEEQIKECIDSGLVTIGSHTSTHRLMDDSLSKEEIEFEVFNSKIVLEKMFDVDIDSFCFPFGKNNGYSTAAFASIIKANYNYAFCNHSGNILFGSKVFLIPRTNLQIYWSKSEFLYQLTTSHDKRLELKKRIICENYERARHEICEK